MAGAVTSQRLDITCNSWFNRTQALAILSLILIAFRVCLYIIVSVYLTLVGPLDVQLESVGARSARSSVVSVSHLPIPPPIWASLPEDNPSAHERVPPVLQVPSMIHLDEGARCVCGSSHRTMQKATLQECVVYTLTTAHRTHLEVQPCQKCPPMLRRFIGPDGRQQGLFNLNNSVLFSHDLLNDYTANFTSSETPFSAWVSVMRKRYLCFGSLPFPHEAVFRNAWFSYAALLQLDGDMKCPKCGPAPETVIWDGVSLSFHRKHILPSLMPPTAVHEKSLVRDSRYLVQAPIGNTDLRRAMRKIMDAAALAAPASEGCTGVNSTSAAEIEGTTEGVIEKAARDASNLIELVFNTHESLKLVNVSLATCFYSQISLTAFANSGMSRHKEYTDLFVQVSQIER